MNYFARNANVVTALALLLVGASVLSACSSSKPKTTDYHVYGEADTLLNRDGSARPLSVVLDVYQLKDKQAFSRLTFDEFVSGKTEVDLFGEELIQKTELVVLPGGKQLLATSLLPEAKYVGIVAAYRTPAEQQWRYLIPAAQIRKTGFWGFLKSNDEKKIMVRLHDCFITIEGVDVELIPGQKAEVTPNCTILGDASSSP